MTIQEAANELLHEIGTPLNSKELAQIALERRMVSSGAKDPIASHAQTIEKNIRTNVYNKPKLIFIHKGAQRLIGLPGWDTNSLPIKETAQDLVEIRVRVPAELYEKVRLAVEAKLKRNLDETVSLLLSKGLTMIAPDIKKAVMSRLESL